MIALTTMVMTVVLMCAINYNKNLKQTHPSRLYSLIAFCIFNMSYSSYVYYIGTIKFICYFAIVDMFRGAVNVPRSGFNKLAEKL